jgi:hypothetical protein
MWAATREMLISLKLARSLRLVSCCVAKDIDDLIGAHEQDANDPKATSQASDGRSLPQKAVLGDKGVYR